MSGTVSGSDRQLGSADLVVVGGGILGLAVARELATLQDGAIELESRPGDTIFRLLLPRASSAAPFSRENVLARS